MALENQHSASPNGIAVEATIELLKQWGEKKMKTGYSQDTKVIPHCLPAGYKGENIPVQ